MKQSSNSWCDVFGHKIPSGYCNGTPYLSISTVIKDGIEREHAFICLKEQPNFGLNKNRDLDSFVKSSTFLLCLTYQIFSDWHNR